MSKIEIKDGLRFKTKNWKAMKLNITKSGEWLGRMNYQVVNEKSWKVTVVDYWYKKETIKRKLKKMWLKKIVN